MSKFALALFFCFAAVTVLSAKPARDRNLKSWRLVCYLGSWANYRPSYGKFVIEDINEHLCTHLIYGFTKLENDRIAVFDPYLDLPDNYGLGAYKRFNALRSRNSQLTTIVAIGGWNEGSLKYSDMARDPNRRRVFINSVLDFLKRYDFDGLDFDWEYPANREGSRPDDKVYFVQVLKELKEAFAPHGYLLTAAVSPGKPVIESAYDIPQVTKYLDFVNVMTYDYHGAWDTFTGHNAPLFSRPDEKDYQSLLNVNFTVNFWLSHGTPANKLIMGIPLYGRCLKLADPLKNGLGEAITGPGDPGPFTGESGMIGFNEICSFLQNERGQWKTSWDDHHLAPYASKGRQWCSYENPKSIQHKVDYLKSKGLGGAMVWSIDTDDFRGHCYGEKYPLLRVIHSGLSGSNWTPPPPPSPGTWTDPPARCQTEGNFGYPNDCSRYYQCILQQGTFRAVERNCPPGTSFDGVQRQCLHSNLVANCGLVTTEKPTTKAPQPSTPKPVPTTAKPVPTTSRPPADTFVCPSAGTFPHPSDCTKFYKCSKTRTDFKAVLFPCPGKLVFNPKSLACDYPKNVPGCS